MPEIDVSQKVMKRVLSFERRRVALWLGVFSIIFLGLLGWSYFYLSLSWRELVERQTLELLSVFGEDRETFQENARDVLSIIWQELPQDELLAGLSLIAGLAIILYWQRRRLGTIWKKLSQIRRSPF